MCLAPALGRAAAPAATPPAARQAQPSSCNHPFLPLSSPQRYNLRKANESLKANWGEYMTRCTFNWKMIKTICTELHVYDPKRNYR